MKNEQCHDKIRKKKLIIFFPNGHRISTMNVRKKPYFHHYRKWIEEEDEEAEGRYMHQVPGIRDKVMSRHVGTSGPMSRQALSTGQSVRDA